MATRKVKKMFKVICTTEMTKTGERIVIYVYIVSVKLKIYIFSHHFVTFGWRGHEKCSSSRVGMTDED